ncbi:MAG: hypothetical protein AABX04_04180 [Nanoarchaeota archaeon]
MPDNSVQIIDEKMFKELDSRLESLGVIKSEPAEYRSFNLSEVDAYCRIAKRAAQEDLLKKAEEMGATYLRLMPNAAPDVGMVSGVEQTVGEAYKLKVYGGSTNGN